MEVALWFGGVLTGFPGGGTPIRGAVLALGFLKSSPWDSFP